MEASKDLLLMEEKEPSLFGNGGGGRSEDGQKGKEGRRRRARPGGRPAQHVLGKVKDFLGAIAEANEKLQLASRENGRSDYDIEVLTGNENEYIELDLLLGLTDLQTPEAVAAAEAAVGGSRPPLLPSYAAESPSGSEEDADEEEALNTDSVHPAGPGRGRKRPNITVLD
ncbi:unnamed protein product [Spirodela intermedia]|uniref:Uncharacterized protein n=2 Tax=Spirodela intermedia TaxID=51605 RepID=A0A7I8L1B1_SPIIN|nr:unnamed protein product [Spirodela intermedia]CAA6666297.1 unnamed protein product [Spirodela intermedia]CAA7403075.1 unnamed protein product [Spirodela intermedia]